MAPPLFRALLVLLLSTLALACGHKIGDECQTSVDCSQGGERLCDITQPGGYCTVFNCEPGTCPEESSCIAFGAALSTAPACRDMSGLSRLQRAFCMLSCSSDGDCRGGYTCQDLGAVDNAWRNALAIDPDRPSKVCVADFEKPGASGAASESTLPSPNVCTGPSTAQGGSSGAASGGAGSGGASSGGASSAGASSAGASSGATGGVGGSDGGSSGEGGSPESAGAGGNGG